VAEPVGQAIHRYRNGGDQQQDDSQGFAIHGGTGRSPPPGAFEGISRLKNSVSLSCRREWTDDPEPYLNLF
jgi:hypothetical protein